MLFFTSDLHFGHQRDFLYKPRGFSSIEEHDEQIIKNWNSLIGENDVCYVLGDLMLNDTSHGLECLKKLNGEIRVIRGNHDTSAKWELYNKLSDWNFHLEGWSNMIKYKKFNIYLSHFPTITSDKNKSPYLREHLLNFFGHTHSKEKMYKDNFFMYNVALDANDNCPVFIEDIIEYMKEQAALAFC